MFSRGSRSTGRHARVDRPRRDQTRPQRSLADELALEPAADPARDPAGGPTGDPAWDPAGTGAGAPEPAGPYDVTEAPAGVNRLNLGSLRIPAVPGVEVRVQAGQDGKVQQVFLVDGDSLLQLGAFAAPRTEPIWDEVREEIRSSLFQEGVAAQDVTGPYGTELRARVRTPNGLKDLRFVGVNGPRWLVRAVYQGPAAVDPSRAARLTECLRGVVVDRGDEARPTKEPLPLRLSDQLAAQLPGPGGTATPAGPTSLAPAGPAGNGPAGNGPAATGTIYQTGAGAPRRKPSPRPRRHEAAPGQGAGPGPVRG